MSVDEVTRIYDILVADFAADADPIAPAGLRDRGLLQSAVGRQFTGFNGQLKYPRAIDNAASLTFGLCNDHPFYNGNKRTALVAMLVHLDRNKLTLMNVGQGDLFEMMVAVADHRLGVHAPRRRSDHRAFRRSPDEEVAAISAWLSDRVKKLSKGERQVTYRQLRHILARFGFELGEKRNNTIEIIQVTSERRGILRKRTVEVRRRVGTIGYHDEGSPVPITELKSCRRQAKLREEDGVDSDSFYDTGAMVDEFVNRYRTVLRRLARA